MAEVRKKRPSMPKFSKDLLIHRNIEGHLAKQGKYTKATRVKDAADRMEATEMETTQATFDAELSLKVPDPWRRRFLPSCFRIFRGSLMSCTFVFPLPLNRRRAN